MNNENFNSLNIKNNHTSYQSVQTQWKPSIRVGYVPHKSKDISLIEVKVPKVREIVTQERKERYQKRHVKPSYLNQNLSHNRSVSQIKILEHTKANRVESYNKYQRSSLFNNSHTDNSQNSRVSYSTQKSSRKVLPGYQDNGIKQIIEYNHAKPYRNISVTEKCNNVPASNRSIRFQELHEYDFRHRPQRF